MPERRKKEGAALQANGPFSGGEAAEEAAIWRGLKMGTFSETRGEYQAARAGVWIGGPHLSAFGPSARKGGEI